MLPSELTFLIFRELETSDLLSCAFVCRQWMKTAVASYFSTSTHFFSSIKSFRSFIRLLRCQPNMRSLVHNLDFSTISERWTSQLTENDMLEAFIVCVNPSLRRLNLDNCTSLTRSLVEHLAKLMESEATNVYELWLVHVNLRCGTSVARILLACRNQLELVNFTASSFPLQEFIVQLIQSAELISLSIFPMLSVIYVDEMDAITEELVEQLVTMKPRFFPNLQEIHAMRCYNCLIDPTREKVFKEFGVAVFTGPDIH